MSVGMGQILLILVLVFIIFGAGKLPKMMGDLAKGLKAFKYGMADEKEKESEEKLEKRKDQDHV